MGVPHVQRVRQNDRLDQRRATSARFIFARSVPGGESERLVSHSDPGAALTRISHDRHGTAILGFVSNTRGINPGKEEGQ